MSGRAYAPPALIFGFAILFGIAVPTYAKASVGKRFNIKGR
jgi:hypothetical protein